MHKIRELGILHFRVIPGKKWSCVNSVIFIFVNILWLLEAQLLPSWVRLIVKVSVLLLELADNCSCGAELAFCPAMCWVFGFLVSVQSPTFPGTLRQEMILVWLTFIWSAKWQLLQGFFPYSRCDLGLSNSPGKYDKYTAWIKVSGIFGCWGQFSICEREQIVAPGSEVPCLLHRRGAGQKFHLFCRPVSSGRIQASSHWLILI